MPQNISKMKDDILVVDELSCFVGKTIGKQIYRSHFFKGTISVISSDPLCKDDNVDSQRYP